MPPPLIPEVTLVVGYEEDPWVMFVCQSIGTVCLIRIVQTVVEFHFYTVSDLFKKKLHVMNFSQMRMILRNFLLTLAQSIRYSKVSFRLM